MVMTLAYPPREDSRFGRPGRPIGSKLIGLHAPAADPDVIPAPKKRACSQQPSLPLAARDIMAQRRVPIWLGPGKKHTVVEVPELQLLVPAEAANPSVIEVARLEAECRSLEADRKYVQAAYCLELSIILRRRLLGDTHEGVSLALEGAACLFNDWGVDCMRAGQFTAALELLKKVQTYMEADSTPQFRRRTALHITALHNLACYFRARGKLNAALQFAEKASKIEQRFKEAEDPARNRLNHGVLLSGLCRHEEAMQQIDSALSVLQDEELTMNGGIEGDIHDISDDIAIEMAVAHHNMWVEHGHVSKRNSILTSAGLSHLVRAANIVKQKLGEKHPLMVKMVQSLAVAQEYSQDPEKVRSVEHTSGLGRFPSLVSPGSGGPSTPRHQKDLDAAHALQRPATTMADGVWQRPEEVTQQVRASTTSPHSARQRPPSPRRLKPLGSARTPRGGAAAACRQADVQGFGGSSRFSGASPQPQSHINDGPESATLPPRPATVASYPLQMRPSQAVEDDRRGTPGTMRESPSPRPDSNATAASMRLRQLKAAQAEALNEQMTMGSMPSSTRGTHGKGPTYRDFYHAVRASEEYNIDSVRRSRMQELTRGPTPNQTVEQRLCTKPGGPRENTRKAAFRIVYEARQNYIGNAAALKIQKCFRGYMHRRAVERQMAHLAHKTATLVQSLFRRFLTAKQIKTRMLAVTKIQTSWRSRRMQRQFEHDSVSYKLFLRLARGWLTRVRLCGLRKATVFMQRIVRGFIARNRMRSLRAARAKIQASVLGWHRRRQRRRYLDAQARIAAFWRGELCRQKVLEMHDAATAIQEAWRGRTSRRAFARSRFIAKKLASAWRSYRVRNILRLESRIRMIQAWLRGAILRKRLQRWPVAAVRLQAAWRGACVRYRIKMLVAIALVLQKHARRHLVDRRLRETAAAVICAQRIRRGHIWRCKLTELDQTAVRIQAFWRGGISRWIHKVDMNAAAIRLQRLARVVAARSQLNRKRAAQIRLVNWWRGLDTRSKLNLRQASALTIARVWRGCRWRQNLNRSHRAAQRIQMTWLAHAMAVAETRRSEAAVAIQARARTFVYRQRYLRLEVLACRVKAHWKRRAQSRRFMAMRRLAIRLQAIWRGRRDRITFQRMCEGAMQIQLAWRRMVASWRVQKSNRNARILQAGLLAVLTRRRLRTEASAARLIQRAVRGGQLRLNEKRRKAVLFLESKLKAWIWRRRFRIQRDAAVAIQKTWRMAARRMWFRQRHEAAHHLTSSLRCLWHLKVWRRRSQAATIIQAAWRGMLSRNLMARRGSAATSLQAAVRRWLTCRLMARRAEAASLIQAEWRKKSALNSVVRLRGMHLATWHLARCRGAKRATGAMLVGASRITRTARGYLTNRDQQQREVAACKIQQVVRGYLTRRRVRRLQAEGLLGIQMLYRAWKARDTVELRRAEAVQQERREKRLKARVIERRRHIAAIQIQKYVRMHLAKSHFRTVVRPAVPKLQAFSRMIFCRTRHLKRQAAALQLQRSWRCFRDTKLKRKHEAARLIQRAFHQYMLHKHRQQFDIGRHEEAAEKIQAAWRCLREIRQYKVRRYAAASIQALARGWQARARRRHQEASATMIQASIARRRLGAKHAEQQRGKVLKVQAFARRVVASRQVRKKILAANRLQAFARQVNSTRVVRTREDAAATRIQAYFRMWRIRRSGRPGHWPIPMPQIRQQAITRLQGASRGHLWRKRLARLHEAACRIQCKIRYRRFQRAWERHIAAATVLAAAWRGTATRKRLCLQRRGLEKAYGLSKSAAWRLKMQPHLHKAAITIQRMLRGRWVRLSVQKRRAAVLRIQTEWRAYMARRFLRRARAAKWRLQGLIHRFRWRKNERVMIKVNVSLRRIFKAYQPLSHKQRIKGRAITIQRIDRGWQSRQRLQHMQDIASRLQAVSRACLARLLRQRRLRALLRIQASFKVAAAHRSVMRRRAAVVKIQAVAKARQGKEHHRQKVEAAGTIARIYRGHAVRLLQVRRQQAATTVASSVRTWLAQKSFLRTVHAIRLLQRWWRGGSCRLQLRRRDTAATRIATAWRCWHIHERYLHVRRAGSVLVGAVLMWRQSRLRRRRRQAATFIASFWRGYCVRQNVYYLGRSARRIQRWWRDLQVCTVAREVLLEVLWARRRLEYQFFVLHVVSIQRSWRAYYQKKRGLRLVKHMILRMQARYRSWAAKREVAELRTQAVAMLGTGEYESRGRQSTKEVQARAGAKLIAQT